MRLLVLLVWVFALPVAAQTPVAGFTPGSFRVTEGGAAEYRIPLRVPPGIAGMEPKLALAYNSQAGNGLLGVGWNLEGLSAITRCPRTMAQDGARGGVNYDANDRYCLDGQRLVAISGSYGADGTEYRTERESFSKIVSHGQAGSGPAWFKVWTKAGQILEYGNSADSRIEIQANDTVRTWAVNRVSDRKGNSIVTTYFEDRANGEYRPASVAYGSNHMTFGYAGRPDATPLYDGGGSKVLAAHLLTQVRTFVSGVLVKDYRLAYGQGTTTLRSRLNTVQECDADANCLPATALAWRPETPGINAVLNTTQVWADDWRALYQVHPGDFNGDGITDIWMTGFNGNFFCPGPGIASANNCAQIWNDDWRPLYQIHTGDFNGDGVADIWMTGFNGNFFCAGPGIASANNCAQVWPDDWRSLYQIHTGDFNGDGVTDLWLTGFNGTFFCAGPGIAAGFNCAQVWNDDWRNLYQIHTGDFNGDGVTDIWMTGFNGNFFCAGPGIASANNCAQVWPDDWRSLYQIHTGDFNGDGITDLWLTGFNGTFFCAGPGIAAGFNCAQVWHDDWRSLYQIHKGDFNGDGITDIWMTGFNGGFFCPGPGIASANNCAQVWHDDWRPLYQIHTGDFNGDGSTDLWMMGFNGEFFAAGGSRADLVASISASSGVAASITYRPLTDSAVYTKGAGSSYPIADLTLPLHAVSSVTTGNGQGGSNTVNYAYAGLRAASNGRGLLGFSRTSATSVASALKTTATYRQEFPLTGLPCEVRQERVDATSGASIALIARTRTTYGLKTADALGALSDVALPAGDACPASSSSWYAASQTPGATRHFFPYAARSLESTYDLNGVALPEVTTETSYDAYGNPASINVCAGDGHSKATTNTFAGPDLGNWQLGLLSRSTVRSPSPIPCP